MKENKISFSQAVLMNINLMVGAGIYIGPTTMAQYAGNASFLGWPLAGLIFLPIVWSISQVAKLFPGQGSFYSYSNKVLGKTAGFISGWLYFLGFVSIGALQTIGLQEILINQWGLTIIKNYPITFTAIFLIFVCLINMCTLEIVANIQSSATILKLMPLIFVVGVFAFYFNPTIQLFQTSRLHNLILCVPVALFGFWGFESCCNISHLIKGDKKNASRAILTGFGIVIAIYTLFHFGLIHIMHGQGLGREGVASFVSYLNFSNPVYSALLNMIIFSSISLAYFSAIHGGFIANASLIHAMADHGVIFFSKTLTKVNKYHRPVAALVMHTATMFLFITLINNKNSLYAISNLTVLTTFVLTFVSLFIVQRKLKAYSNAFITLIAFFCIGILCFYSIDLIGKTLYERIINVIPLLTISLVGILCYLIKEMYTQETR